MKRLTKKIIENKFDCTIEGEPKNYSVTYAGYRCKWVAFTLAQVHQWLVDFDSLKETPIHFNKQWEDLAEIQREKEIANQRILSQLVSREVGNNVSELVSHFAGNEDALEGSGYDFEDIQSLCVAPDYEACLDGEDIEEVTVGGHTGYIESDKLYTGDAETIALEEHDGIAEEQETEDPVNWEEFLKDQGWVKTDCNKWFDDSEIIYTDDEQEACEHFCLDVYDYEREALEHWVVSDWFAGKLAKHGEITGELFGLTIWGRTTSGQSISIDGVIRRIAEDMEILVGQSNDWSK